MVATRASKRLRLMVEPQLPQPGVINLLETLPFDLVREVLRHCSTRPFHERWVSYVSVQDLLSCVEARGNIGHVACSVIKALCVDNEPSGAGVVVLNGEVEREVYRKLVEAVAPTLEALDVYGWSGAGTELLKRCGRIRKLMLNGESAIDRIPGILAVVGVQLDELKLTGTLVLNADAVKAVASSCTQLRCLTMAQGIVETSLSGIWRTVGGTLETLGVVGGMVHSEGGQAIRGEDLYVWCERLAHVELVGCDGFQSMEGDRVWILKLKERLQDFVVMDLRETLSLDELRRIYIECPNALFGLCIRRKIVPNFELLGPRLRRLDVRASEVFNFTSNVQELDINVERLSFTATLDSIPLDLFLLSWKSLRVLELDCSLDMGDMILKELENVTGNVEKLSMSWRHFPKDLRGFVSRNRSLSMVSIACSKTGDQQRCTEVIEEVAELTELKELVISSPYIKTYSTRIAAACKKLSPNAKDVYIGRHSYR